VPALVPWVPVELPVPPPPILAPCMYTTGSLALAQPRALLLKAPRKLQRGPRGKPQLL
jgi:hypothetical protein